MFSFIYDSSFWGMLALGTSIVGAIYGFLRNFKSDINSHIDRLDKKMDTFECKLLSIEERMFWMATGKKLEDAILEEKMKQVSK